MAPISAGRQLRVYLIGSLRNPKVPELGNELRVEGYEVFNDWWAASEDADEWWQRYEQGRGHTFAEALRGPFAEHVFAFDLKYLHWANTGILMLPAGKSAHLEFGFLIGQGKRAYVLLDGEPERYDFMYLFTNGVFSDKQGLFAELKGR